MPQYPSRRFAIVFAGLISATTLHAETLVPDDVLSSSLLVSLDYQGQALPANTRNNIASPVAIDDQLYILDQRTGGILVRDENGATRQVIDASNLPSDVTPPSNNSVLGIAGEGDRAYVVYYSETLPAGFSSSAPMPDDQRYRADTPRFELIYSYDRAEDGTLSNPEPITSFDAAINGHRSAGMLIMPDGTLLYARGDNLSPDYDGLSAPQDLNLTLSKLLLINPENGAVEVAASGLRNVQRLTYADDDETTITFADIGWQTAEEVNQISVSDLQDTSTIENFGWGRNADGLAREGSFYVNAGPEDFSVAIGVAPVNEPGFSQPFAQFGREDRDGFFAISGPVASTTSFSAIGLLFGDLASGELFATLAGAEGTLNDVYGVGILGPDGTPTTYQGLFGTNRDEPRFFNFSDGTAGILFERSGSIYRVTEVTIAAVPLSASGLYLGIVLVGAAGVRSLSRIHIAQR